MSASAPSDRFAQRALAGLPHLGARASGAFAQRRGCALGSDRGERDRGGDLRIVALERLEKAWVEQTIQRRDRRGPLDRRVAHHQRPQLPRIAIVQPLIGHHPLDHLAGLRALALGRRAHRRDSNVDVLIVQSLRDQPIREPATVVL